MLISTADWLPLRAELGRWVDAGATASLWWRDDDAIAPTPQLDRMLALVAAHEVPLGLAVIPAHVTAALGVRLSGGELVEVLQHGYAHQNHAAVGERAAEFGPQRSIEARISDVARGWQALAAMPRLIPMLVPPWNRYHQDIAAGVAALGFRAISAFGPARDLPSGIVECNCHVDIISWRTTRGFAGVAKTMDKLTHALVARREGTVPRHEPIGVLTHHLVHDEGCWQFMAELLAGLEGDPAVRWLAPSVALSMVARR